MKRIVISRSGALLLAPSSMAGTRYSDLEAALPGVSASIEEALASAPPEAFVRELDLAGETFELTVVEALAVQRLECDVVRVLKDALAPIERQATERDVSVRLEVEKATALRARLDPVKIAWVVSALVGNALRFVRSGSRHLPGGCITVRASLRGESLALEVEDDGPGIPPAVVSDLLRQGAGEPPYRGVALRLARDIVHAHGGSFLVKSSEGGPDSGTKIQISLPVG
jgi:two-component system sensor histidine kinase TctE